MKPTPLSKRALDLLSSAESIGSGALAVAAAELKKNQEKEAADKALKVLSNADKILKDRVSLLKQYRKLEKEAHKSLKKFDAAFEAFAKHGDVARFAKEAEVSMSCLVGYGF